MNSVATLIYTNSELVRGKKEVRETERKEVFCEINSLSFEAKANLKNNNFKGTVKCVINRVHDSKNLTYVEIDKEKYKIESVDRYKSSDTITLLLSEVM